jgi:DNA-binding NarL/FixJ family response regulator
MKPATIRVLLADDSAVVRRPMRALLHSEPNIELVGEAGNFLETIEMAAELDPDVVILDMHMPDHQRFSPEIIRSALSKTDIIAISVYMDDATQMQADAFGARKFLDKSTLADELIPAIRDL